MAAPSGVQSELEKALEELAVHFEGPREGAAIDASTFFVGRLLFFAVTDPNKLRAMQWLRLALEAFIDKTGSGIEDWRQLLGEQLAGKVEALTELAVALYQAERMSGFEVESTERGRTAVRKPRATFFVERSALDKHLPRIVKIARALGCLHDAGKYYVFDLEEDVQWRTICAAVETEALRTIGAVVRRLVRFVPLELFSKKSSQEAFASLIQSSHTHSLSTF